MPTAKNGFHILNLHPKKYIMTEKMALFWGEVEPCICGKPFYLIGREVECFLAASDACELSLHSIVSILFCFKYFI